MVVFTCNNCGDSLQKPKVAKHYQYQCRNSIFLTCVDCQKDFRGDEYVAHTKCFTENERYGGKGYVPKKSANKGEKKQRAWIDVVQNVLANSNNLTVPERNLLNSISRHENIPRKKAKFYNFIQSMSGNRANMTIVETVFEKMEKAFKKATAESSTNVSSNKKNNENIEENQNNSNICKESDDLQESDAVNKTESNTKTKKSKKRQLETDVNENNEPASKRKNETEETNISQEETNTENGVSKFSWKNTITEIVTAKGEVSLKKLRKKAVAQYLAHFPECTSEKAASKFEKKLAKVSDILVAEDKVRLASS